MTDLDDAWMAEAACAGKDTNLWFPETGENPRHAKTVCGTCPVTADCLAWAITNDERYGYWGGLGPKKRAKLRPGTTTTRPQATARHTEILRLTAEGLDIGQIAARLGISKAAVSYHRGTDRAQREASA